MKKYIALLLAIVMVFSLCACGNDPDPQETQDVPEQSQAPENESNAPEFVNETYKINVCTATSSGIFYAGGTALAQLWQEKIPGYMTSATSSSGSGENITLLANNEANVAFIQSDYLLNSYNGWGKRTDSRRFSRREKPSRN